MRFDSTHLSQFKTKHVVTSNFEFRFAVPYHPWVDALGIVHGPSWEMHLFSDMSFETQFPKYLIDVGIGSRLYFLTAPFGRIGFNLEFTPYQNAILTNGSRWGQSAFMMSLISAR